MVQNNHIYHIVDEEYRPKSSKSQVGALRARNTVDVESTVEIRDRHEGQ